MINDVRIVLHLIHDTGVLIIDHIFNILWESEHQKQIVDLRCNIPWRLAILRSHGHQLIRLGLSSGVHAQLVTVFNEMSSHALTHDACADPADRDGRFVNR